VLLPSVVSWKTFSSETKKENEKTKNKKNEERESKKIQKVRSCRRRIKQTRSFASTGIPTVLDFT